jgi:hypothetical protein
MAPRSYHDSGMLAASHWLVRLHLANWAKNRTVNTSLCDQAARPCEPIAACVTADTLVNCCSSLLVDGERRCRRPLGASRSRELTSRGECLHLACLLACVDLPASLHVS